MIQNRYKNKKCKRKERGASSQNGKNSALIQKYQDGIFDTVICIVSYVTEFQTFMPNSWLCYKITENFDEITSEQKEGIYYLN